MDMADPNYNVVLGAASMAPVEPEPQVAEEAPMSNNQIVDMEIRDMILARKEASRVWRQPKKEIWDKCINHYKQIYDRTNKEPWQAGTFIPASPKIAEIITSNMHSGLLSPEKPVEYKATQPIFETAVQDVNDLLSVDCDRSDFKIHWTDVLRTICMVGTGIGKIEYTKEYATVKIKERVRPNPLMEMARKLAGLQPAPTEITTEQRMLVKDYASTRNVDLYNLYPEPGSVEIDKDHWIIEEGKICNYKLIELSKDPENPLRNITPELLASGSARVQENPDSQERDEALDEPNKQRPFLDPDQEHKNDEYWGPAPIWMVKPELYGIEEHKYEMVHAWFWLIDGQYVVRSQTTPFRDAEPPYAKGVYIRVPGQFYGIGPLELVLHLQVELNERVNTQQDEINLKLSKPIAVLKDYVDAGDWKRLVSGPGAIWAFKGIDDIKKAFTTIDFDANLGDSWRSIQWLLNEIQEVSGAVKAVVGNDGGGGQDEASTFRGQMLNKQVASERFIMYARMLEVVGLGRAYSKMYQRIYQFKGWQQAEEILGEERAKNFNFVAPEQLAIMAKVVPMGVTSMENKGVKLAQKASEYKLFANEIWFKKVEAAREMVTIGGDPADRTIMTDAEIKELNEMRREMMVEGANIAPPPGAPPGPGGPPSGPVAGNAPGPSDGQPRPAAPARGPGAASIDLVGAPL